VPNVACVSGLSLRFSLAFIYMLNQVSVCLMRKYISLEAIQIMNKINLSS